MLARVRSASVLGIEAYLVDVETDIAHGLPSFATVGLPQGAVKEGRERVNAAIVNAGFEFPLRRITVNLAPADIRKDGSAFDLPVALGVLLATAQVEPNGGGPRPEEYLVVGELGLEGDLRPIRGALSIAMAARDAGLTGMILPAENAAEAAVVRDVAVHPARTLRDVADFLSGSSPITPAQCMRSVLSPDRAKDDVDLSDVRGQTQAKRALEVAAAGAHNLLMVGPPGSGKTMLARRLAGVLPDFTLDEALETTRVHSVAGVMRPGESLVRARPFRAPHHTISDAGLVGGGPYPRPGEVSLAHGGVLFLDELPEFRKNVLEVLRQPLEDGSVTIARAAVSLTYPARFMLAAAMNPCPCGYYGDPGRECRCGAINVERYRARVSGPLLDRIDIQLDVPQVRYRELTGKAAAEPSEAVRARVRAARARQLDRFANRPGIFANAHMSPKDLARHCQVTASADAILRRAITTLRLSARAYHRILKIARTIADLAEAASIEPEHVTEAVQYRSFDRTTG